jgi:hypothetical protein
MRVFLRVLSLLCLCMCVHVLPSCANKETAKVKGVVLFKGKPLPGGTITLVAAEGPGRPASAEIQPDGTFVIATAPVGAVKAVVTNDYLNPQWEHPMMKKQRMMKKMVDTKNLSPAAKRSLGIREGEEEKPIELPNKGEYVAIPKRYASSVDSELSFTIVPGENEIKVELKDK